jgi:hypothetical protein
MDGAIEHSHYTNERMVEDKHEIHQNKALDIT